MSPAIFPSIYIKIRINTWTQQQILCARTLQSSYSFYAWISTQVPMKPDIFLWREERSACLDRHMLWIRPLSLDSWDSPNWIMIYCISSTSCILLNSLISFSCKPQHEAYDCINTPNIFNALGKSLKTFFNSKFSETVNEFPMMRAKQLLLSSYPEIVSSSYLLTSPIRIHQCLN